MKRVSPISALAWIVLGGLSTWSAVPPSAAAPITLTQVPLFASTAAKPNVLLSFANSNSMDEDPSGLAVGSASPASKSEIARTVSKALVSKYTGVINMGLMAFQQTTGGGDPVRLMQLHSSPYDASWDPANYDPTYTGPRKSATKRFRAPNVSNPGTYVYYNVNLPFYDGGNDGNAFCYSPTANAFNNGEVLWSGPWDTYRCFTQKLSTSDALPNFGDGTSEAAAGYNSLFGNFTFFPTDSDLGQGITDFGRFMAWSWVSPAWFSNGSPGRGYIHIPIANLDSTQAAKFNTKMGTSQFAVNGPNDATLPLQNAGLTPLQGSLLTARDYFAGTLSDTSQGGPLATPPASCGRNYTVMLTNGLPSVQADGTASSNVVQMLSDASAAATLLRGQNVLTYVVGFALPFGVNPSQLDTIASAGGTNTAFNANDQATLTGQLDAVFIDILRRSGAASSVALNSASVSTGGYVYQAKFDRTSAGQLLAYPIQADGSLAASPTWDAATQLDAANPLAGRVVITYKPSNGNGIPFRWPGNPASPTANELDVSQSGALNTDPNGVADSRGSDRLNYLRGVRTLEGPNPSTQFRPRNSVLGDILNSGPVYVGAPSANSRDISYSSFRVSNSNRTRMIYAGGNDGFLHAFRASDGMELFAYMPGPVYANISKLTGQTYVHRYFVDGSPNVADAKIGSTWHTVLVSSLNAGGRGVFALDVTDPSSFNEANADQISLWEYNSSNDADVGYVFDKPAIVKLNNGQWAAIFGNGYNNTGSGQSGIFIVDIATGTLIRKILTGSGSAGTPNGIGKTTAADLDGNGTADAVYGGDLLGQMWKFDLSDANAANWGVALSGSPLAIAADSGGTREPITAAPEISPHPQGGVIVLFGTGQYIATGDQSTTGTQSLYGVRDDDAHNSVTRANLVRQTVTSVTTLSGVNYRVVSTNPVSWSTQDGWYMDLPGTGERAVVDPILRSGRVVFTTLVPNADPCSAGGTGWLMEIDFLTGGQLNVSAFDTNGDGRVDSLDTIVGGRELLAISSTPAVQSGYGTEQAPLENKYLNQSTGTVQRVLESGNRLARRRMSWRQER